MKTRKKPYTAAELFRIINSRLEERGSLPDILDYGIPSGADDRQILTYFWDAVFKVRFGGSEGVYLDVFLDGELDESGQCACCLIGSYKTLNRDEEAFRRMALLGADFSLETHRWLSERLDDFTWTGYTVDFLLEGSVKRSLICYDTWDNLQKQLPSRFKTTPHDSLLVTENATGHVVFQGLPE